MSVEVVTDPAELASLFEADRETHIYGLGDLEEPYWSSSTWFRSGPSAVGIVSTGGEWVTGYAMSQSHPDETLRVLMEVHNGLVPETWITGPIGLHDAVSTERKASFKGIHHRMILRELTEQEPEGEVIELGTADLDRVLELRDSDRQGMFFLPRMLSKGIFVGIEESGSLIATAGTHVISDVHSIAAVGSVITHPDHRGRGLGRAVVWALCQRLRLRFRTIGLNVAQSNVAARRVYEDVGFRTAFNYEEAQVL